MSLNQDVINFGKYRDKPIECLLRDRRYCEWLLIQDWFERQNQYVYNRIKAYKPLSFFLSSTDDSKHDTLQDFIKNYKYFNLFSPNKVKTVLSPIEKQCYTFYLEEIEKLKDKMIDNVTYDIKAPTNWLKKLEQKGIPRETFKEFLSAYWLPNITTIVEEIKKAGGIEYKGAKAYIITKDKSLKQEEYWEKLLKRKYGEKIVVQREVGEKKRQNKVNNDHVFFDFARLSDGILYECKLNLKDLSKEQYENYLHVMKQETEKWKIEFILIYLIDNDCVIDMKKKVIYSTKPEKYLEYVFKIKKDASEMDQMIKEFDIKKVKDISNYI